MTLEQRIERLEKQVADLMGGAVAIKRMDRPTLEQVKLVAHKSGLPDSEAEKFFYFYDQKGWKVGKNPMKSLNSAVAGWAVRWRENGGNLNGHPKSLMDKQIDATHNYVQRLIGEGM